MAIQPKQGRLAVPMRSLSILLYLTLTYSLFISALIFGPWHANLFLEKLEEVFKKIQK
jgi:hypothetical protein